MPLMVGNVRTRAYLKLHFQTYLLFMVVYNCFFTGTVVQWSYKAQSKGKKKRKAKEKMGRQHQRVDRSRLQQQSESSRRPSEMAEDCHRCQQWCPYDTDGSGTHSAVVSTSACHPGGRGSLPGPGTLLDVKTWLSTLEIVYLCVFRMRH